MVNCQRTWREILNNKPYANRYLASFMMFVIKWKKEMEIREFIAEGLDDFFETNISAVKGYKRLPVHFVGSVALHLEEEIRRMCQEKRIRPGKILQRPIEGLKDYFSKGK
jgi:glucosamine kinase